MSLIAVTELDCGVPEPPTEFCVGHCHQQIEVDPDVPDFVPFCGSSSCRSYANAEMRADRDGARI